MVWVGIKFIFFIEAHMPYFRFLLAAVFWIVDEKNGDNKAMFSESHQAQWTYMHPGGLENSTQVQGLL